MGRFGGRTKRIGGSARLGLSFQASAAAVNAAHADITAFTTALATRVGTHAIRVAEADTHYLTNEADSANELAAAARPIPVSHSRRISNKDGTLVYEVPINRVHRTQGPLGFADCEDTGEHLTMRIVANINEGRAGIPGGGQKGVISMYPLEGGSGVVEVEPGWTLCPPWVNKNVPIN